MNIIHVICDGNKLRMSGNSFSTSGSINNDIVKFKFSSDWDGLAKKAVFWKQNGQAYEVPIGVDNEAIIPAEVLMSEGVLKFGVYGFEDDTPVRIPSTVLELKVAEGAYKEGSESSVELTPSELEQVEIMLAKTQELVKQMQDLYGNSNPGDLDAFSKPFEVTGKFSKLEKEIFCSPAEDTELHVVSHIKPAYNEATKNLIACPRWDHTWNGITFKITEDNGVRIYGTASGGDSSFVLDTGSTPFVLDSGTYTFSTGCVLPDGVRVAFDAYEDAESYIGYSSGNSLALTKDDSGVIVSNGEMEYYGSIIVSDGTAVDITVYPQLEFGEYATSYVPNLNESAEPESVSSISISISNGTETSDYSVDFGRNISNGTYDWQSGKLFDLDSNTEYSYSPVKMAALSGVNIITANTGYVEVGGYTADNHSLKMLEYNHIPRLCLYGSTDNMSKENAVMLRFKYYGAENYIYNNEVGDIGYQENGKRRGGFVKTKWQGSSSIGFPKKNYTFTFYWDENGDNKRDIPFSTKWGAQSKYCAKANFIDPTHCRNVVAAKLWGECVRSRNTESESYQRMRDLPNAGAIDGYPMLVFINDKYQGIYTMNIPKDEWMFGMSDGEGVNTVLCGENYCGSTEFWEPAVIDGNDWSYEVKPEDTSWVLSSFNKINAALSMGRDTEEQAAAKRAAFEACLDIYSVIDADIFTQRLRLTDNNGKNQLMATYDGVKWIMGMQDLDTCFANHWSGAGFYDHDTTVYNNALMRIIREMYTDIYDARKKELEEGCLSKTNILSTLFNFAKNIPQEAYRAEAELWPEMCSANTNSMQQIVSFVETMCAEVNTSIPTPSTADAGKFLCADNTGAYVLVALTYAEEVAF